MSDDPIPSVSDENRRPAEPAGWGHAPGAAPASPYYEVPPLTGQYGGPQGPPPRYWQGPGEPPRRRSPILRILLIIFGLFLIFFVFLIILGSIANLTGHGRNATALPFGERIGLVRIEGLISQGEEKQFWMDALKQMGETDRIRGIVVRVDSPGGTVGASQELYGMINKLRQKYHKRVYVSMGDLAASGGYYLSSAADRIFANKGTLTGSIGVIFSKPQLSELTKKIGYAQDTIKSGRFKDSTSMTRPMTAEERSMFDFLIMDTYQQFMNDVLQFRAAKIEQALQKFPPTAWADYKFTKPTENTAAAFLRQIADGRVYTGAQALTLGLIDEIGSLDDTVQALAKDVHFPGKPELYELKPHKGLSDYFRSEGKSLFSPPQGTLEYRMELP